MLPASLKVSRVITFADEDAEEHGSRMVKGMKPSIWAWLSEILKTSVLSMVLSYFPEIPNKFFPLVNDVRTSS